MTTLLEKTLKRELSIGGRAYILAISPEGLKLTLKGRRKGLELQWDALVSGDAALAIALNASIGKLTIEPAALKQTVQPAERSKNRRATKKVMGGAGLASPQSTGPRHEIGAVLACRAGLPQTGPLSGPPDSWDRS